MTNYVGQSTPRLPPRTSGSLDYEVQQTKNYVWSSSDLLGRGATSYVYKGFSKMTGELCAVKVFTDNLGLIPQKEVEMLRQLQHENLVRLLAIERQKSMRDVIITELCDGGSLFNILEEPENQLGLSEDEFLLVLFDVVAGMEYLRQRQVVHRDLKPGNIMKCVSPGGVPLYKLIDFGAARVLQTGEDFMSVHGTPEYLHPDMYCRALINPQQGGHYHETVDLWSLGATLFHAATGQLPFIPFLGGRVDKGVMYDMTSRKPPGKICGRQYSLNGQIIYSDNLPETCRLSNCLKHYLTRILAGLMESQPEHSHTFERLFELVSNLRRGQYVSVFVSPACTLDRYYFGCFDVFNAGACELSCNSEDGPTLQAVTTEAAPQTRLTEVYRYLSQMYNLDSRELDVVAPGEPSTELLLSAAESGHIAGFASAHPFYEADVSNSSGPVSTVSTGQQPHRIYLTLYAGGDESLASFSKPCEQIRAVLATRNSRAIWHLEAEPLIESKHPPPLGPPILLPRMDGRELPLIVIARLPPVDIPASGSAPTNDKAASTSQQQQASPTVADLKKLIQQQLELPNAFVSRLKAIRQLMLQPPQPTNDDPVLVLKHHSAYTYALFEAAAHLALSQYYCHLTANQVVVKIRSLVRTLKLRADVLKRDYELFVAMLTQMLDTVRPVRSALEILQAYRGELQTPSSSPMASPRVTNASLVIGGPKSNTSPQSMNGSMIQSTLSVPGDAHSSIGSSASDTGPLSPDMPPVERLYRLLERFENNAQSLKLNSENRLNDSVKYVDQYATVLLVRDELGKKWAKCMRETCFGASSTPVAAAQSPSVVSSSTAPTAQNAPDGDTLMVDSHIALDALLPCTKKFEAAFDSMKGSLQTALRSKKLCQNAGPNASAATNEWALYQGIFKFEKSFIENRSKQFVDHLDQHCLQRTRALLMSFTEWTKMIQTAMLRLEKLRVFVNYSVEQQKFANEELRKRESELQEQVAAVLEHERQLLAERSAESSNGLTRSLSANGLPPEFQSLQLLKTISLSLKQVSQETGQLNQSVGTSLDEVQRATPNASPTVSSSRMDMASGDASSQDSSTEF